MSLFGKIRYYFELITRDDYRRHQDNIDRFYEEEEKEWEDHLQERLRMQDQCNKIREVYRTCNLGFEYLEHIPDSEILEHRVYKKWI